MLRNRRSQYLFGMILFTVIFTTQGAVRAQKSPTPTPSAPAASTPSLEKEFFRNILHDQKAIWTAPLHIQRDDATWMIPSGVGLMALITTDRITGDEIAESNRQVAASRAISYAGSAYTLGAVAATFYLVGREKSNERARETGLLSAEALLNGGIVQAALKGITQRARPMSGVERSEFLDGGDSFPSGHSVNAWAVATIIANEYQHRRWVQLAAYGVATAVSVARFTEHKHYLSDVLAGSALGYGIGKYVYHPHHRSSQQSVDGKEESRWPVIAPQFNRSARQYGVALRWSF